MKTRHSLGPLAYPPPIDASPPRTWLALATALALMTLGCGDDGPGPAFDAAVADASVVDAPDPDATPLDATPPDAAPTATAGLDVLFVVDNSGSMAEEQLTLRASFSQFVNSLETAYGSRPDLHVGVISTDMGAGPFQGTGCSMFGDNGNLRANPVCGVADPYIIDIAEPGGGRTQNFSGTLTDAMSCIGDLGISGCGFEQPLAAVRRALDGTNPNNAGFLRQDTMLAVVIMSDEDDCSVTDTAMYDTSQNDINAPLGPLSSFRCFEFGVRCDPDQPRVPGPRSNCVVRENSAYMPTVQGFIDFLTGLRPPGDVFVATLQGDPTPVGVTLDPNINNIPALAPSCTSANGQAVPGVRLDVFRAGFPQRNLQASICQANLENVLIDLGTTLGNLLP